MVGIYRNIWKMVSQKVKAHLPKHMFRTVRKNGESPENIADVASLKRVLGLIDANFFSDEKLLELVKGAKKFNIPAIRANRKLVASVNGGLNDPSCLVFVPDWGIEKAQQPSKKFNCSSISGIQRPETDEDIAFMSVLELGELIRTKQITSQELTQIYMQRLKRYNPVLEAVVTYTEELANQRAKEADELLARGVYLGPLHGIPYGLKDIISVPKYKTTWGSKSYKDQVLEMVAWVYKRLKLAGAVLVAKLASGSLAYDDIWFRGRTRNPWNIKEFTTGSSSGPAACTSAGMVPFSIGSETIGSMTLPSARCGVTALRPTFGCVGRTGVTSLSESLVLSLEVQQIVLLFWMLLEEKIRIIFHQEILWWRILSWLTLQSLLLDILTMLSRRVRRYESVDVWNVGIGVTRVRSFAFLEFVHVTGGGIDFGFLSVHVVDVLRSKGVNMVPFKLKYEVDTVGIASFTMYVDTLAHFDEWQRSGKDDDYESQDQWPPELRRARIFPAVDYVQGQRARGKLIRVVRDSLTVDAFIGNATDWERVCMGNLVGMPVIVVPSGFPKISDPPCDDCVRRTTVTTGIYAPPHHDHIALALAMAYQSVTDHHKQRPPIDDLGPNDSIQKRPRVSN